MSFTALRKLWEKTFCLKSNERRANYSLSTWSEDSKYVLLSSFPIWSHLAEFSQQSAISRRLLLLSWSSCLVFVTLKHLKYPDPLWIFFLKHVFLILWDGYHQLWRFFFFVVVLKNFFLHILGWLHAHCSPQTYVACSDLCFGFFFLAEIAFFIKEDLKSNSFLIKKQNDFSQNFQKFLKVMASLTLRQFNH